MIALLQDTTDQAIHPDQADRPGELLVNLDDRWRAAGRPIGRHPTLWVELASPLIAGLSRYLATLSEISPRFPADPLLIRKGDPSADRGAGGDLLAHGVLADAYAAFLGAGPGPAR